MTAPDLAEPDYIAYFENLARRHKAIAHNPEEEKQAFYVVTDDNLTELELAIRNRLSLPALLLDQYLDEDDTEADNNRLRIQGGLSVICSVEPGNTVSKRAARHQARLIARSILKRIRRDCRPGGTLYGLRISMSTRNPGEPTPVIGGGSATGWGYEFDWTLPTSQLVEVTDWSDLETPA